MSMCSASCALRNLEKFATQTCLSCEIYLMIILFITVLSCRSPGFGISLVAETTTGAMLSVQTASTPAGEGKSVVPEDLGKQAAEMLLEEIYRGGCIDSRHQSLVFLYMILGQRDVSKILTGPLTPYSIQFLRHLKEFFGVMFKIEAQQGDDNDRETGGENKVLLSCVGVGYTNINKAMV